MRKVQTFLFNRTVAVPNESLGGPCSSIPALNNCLPHPPLPSSTFNFGWKSGFIHSLCPAELYIKPLPCHRLYEHMKKPHDRPCGLWTRALSGHNSTAATRSELLFHRWHCCYWLTLVCLWKSLKLVVWVNCSLTKKKITRLVYYLANLCGEDNVGNFVKYTKGVGLLSLNSFSGILWL